jgi:hypothetical protein
MQTQEQKPGNPQQAAAKKVSWLRITFLALTILVVLILGFLLIQNSADSSSTLLNATLLVISILIGTGQLIPIFFPSKSEPQTIIQHFHAPADAQGHQQQTTQPITAVPSAIEPAAPLPANNPNPSPAPTNSPPIAPPSNITLPTGPVFYFNVAHLPNKDELYGRKRERMTLLERTRKGDSTSIVGLRRIGKTWLLDYLKQVAPDELAPNFRIASLDGTTTRRKTVSTFVTQALNALGVPLIGNPADLELDTLTKAVESLHNQHLKLVLCIDEFEGFFNQQDFDYDFFAGLRYLATNGLILVTVSKNPLIDLVGERCQTSPFFNIFEQITLKPFNKLEAKDFVQAKGTQASFNDDERAVVLKYGQEENKREWTPLRLQLVGEKLLDDKKLAIQGHAEYYRPGEQDYWKDFGQRVEKIYGGAVR